MDPKENICFQKEYLIVDKKCQFQVRPLKVKNARVIMLKNMTKNLEGKFYLMERFTKALGKSNPSILILHRNCTRNYENMLYQKLKFFSLIIFFIYRKS